MSNLMRAWVNDRKIPDKATSSLLRYLRENQNTLIPYGDYVFDRNSLGSMINLKICEDCLRYQKGDCCQGNPCPMPDEQRQRTETILPECILLTEDSRRLEVFNSCGALTPKGSISTRGSPKRNNESVCMMSYLEDGKITRCAIHKWCLLHDKNPLDYKPYACSLFPIDGIVMPSGKTFVFCACKSTSGFTSWFYGHLPRICINYENLHKAIARDVGNSKYLRSLNLDNIIEDRIIDGYRPAYIEQEKVLRYFVGDDAYNHLSSEMSRVV